MNHPVKPHNADGSLMSMRYCLIVTMIHVHLILSGKPGEGGGNPCGDHQASSPPAGRQEQSQDVETGPDCNVQDDPQSTQDFSHLEVLSPKMQ